MCEKGEKCRVHDIDIHELQTLEVHILSSCDCDSRFVVAIDGCLVVRYVELIFQLIQEDGVGRAVEQRNVFQFHGGSRNNTLSFTGPRDG